jgi:hypothetical protein
MMKKITAGLALGAMMFCAGVFGQQEPEVTALTQLDRQFMQEQRGRIDELARSKLGRQLHSTPDNDLSILQALLDRNLVRQDQRLELQAMGMVLGDILARDQAAKWIVYQDRQGRSRALQLGGTDNFLFPVTMISRRAEVGAAVDVTAIYEKASRIMEPYRRPLPFQ